MKLKLSVGIICFFALYILLRVHLNVTEALNTIRYVAPGGNCGSATPCYSSIQGAVNAAAADDEIRVAAGTYSGVQNIPLMNTTNFTATQVVGINKNLTLRGGFTTANWSTSNPTTNITIINAQNAGRGIAIVGDVTVTVNGFQITGGNATGLGGRIPQTLCHPANFPNAVGGGIYVGFATVKIENNVIHNNTGSTSNSGGGGGIALHCSSSQVVNNEIRNNTGSTGGAYGFGGGLFVAGRASQNQIPSITVLIQRNELTENIAGNGSYSSGGGLWIGEQVNGTVSQNMIAENIASTSLSGNGGGVYLLNNTIASIHLDGNTIIHNIATPGALSGQGGGVYIQWNKDFTFTNNIVAANHATTEGSGFYIYGMQGVPFNGVLKHNTIAANTGVGEGVFIFGGSYISGPLDAGTVTLINNIIANQSVALHLRTSSGIMARLEADHTLWDGNGIYTVTSGSGNSILNTNNNVVGNPAFVSNSDFHIRSSSAAVDTAVNAGIVYDIDGEARPSGNAPDIGADELVPVLNINYSNGAPGSYFTLQGHNFPSNTQASLTINGYPLGTLAINAMGAVTFILSTANADEGDYVTRVRVNPEDSMVFTLDHNAPVRPREDMTSPVFDVPAGIAFTHRLYLPTVGKN